MKPLTVEQQETVAKRVTDNMLATYSLESALGIAKKVFEKLTVESERRTELKNER